MMMLLFLQKKILRGKKYFCDCLAAMSRWLHDKSSPVLTEHRLVTDRQTDERTDTGQ